MEIADQIHQRRSSGLLSAITRRPLRAARIPVMTSTNIVSHRGEITAAPWARIGRQQQGDER